jgi:hypothetical protein
MVILSRRAFPGIIVIDTSLITDELLAMTCMSIRLRQGAHSYSACYISTTLTAGRNKPKHEIHDERPPIQQHQTHIFSPSTDTPTNLSFLRLHPRLHTLRTTAVLSLRPTRPFTTTRLALKENMSSTADQASPGTSSNVAPTNPTATSGQNTRINQSRATDRGSGEASPSTANLVNQGMNSESQPGEEDTGAHEAMKPDPDASREEKRRMVEKEGAKKLDPADN